MSNSILKEEYRGILIRVEFDEYPVDPMDNDNLSTIVDRCSKYKIGDSSYECRENLTDSDIVFPLYMMDHGDISISTEPFGCRWDSGKIGYVYITEEDIKKEFNIDTVTLKDRENAINILKNEVKHYDRYLRGECYQWVIPYEDCTGGYSDPQQAINEAKECVDHMYNRIKVSHIDRLKKWIKGKVCIQYRYPLSDIVMTTE